MKRVTIFTKFVSFLVFFFFSCNSIPEHLGDSQSFCLGCNRRGAGVWVCRVESDESAEDENEKWDQLNVIARRFVSIAGSQQF